MRMREGLDVWFCSQCGAAVAIGGACGCGNTYAEELQRKFDKSRPKPKRAPKKTLREPAGEGEFIKSYLFRKEERNKNNFKKFRGKKGNEE